MIKKTGFFYLELSYFFWSFLTLSYFWFDAPLFDPSGLLGIVTAMTVVTSILGVITVVWNQKTLKFLCYALLIGTSIWRNFYFPALFHFALPVLNLLALFFIWYEQSKEDRPLMGTLANLTLALSYLAAALSKWADPLWRSGDALFTILSTNFMAYEYIVNNLEPLKSFLQILTWALMAFQVLYFLSVLRPKWLRPLNYLMMLFHLSTLAVMNVIPVSVAYLLLHSFILIARPANRSNAVAQK